MNIKMLIGLGVSSTEDLHLVTSHLLVEIWLFGEARSRVVALFSVEAKFRSMVKGICELLWLKELLEEIGSSIVTPIKLFCDNKLAI